SFLLSGAHCGGLRNPRPSVVTLRSAPDNKKLAFIDQAMRIRVYDDASGKVTDVDKSPDWIAHDGLEAFRFQWSPDSRWLAYARPAGTSNNAIFLFDTRAGKLQQATSG